MGTFEGDEDRAIERALYLADLERREAAWAWQAAPPPPPPPRRTGWWVVLLVALAVFVGVLVPGDPVRTVLEATGLREAHVGPDVDAVGPHAFTMTQRDDTSPVGWDPCEPVTYAVNPHRAPADWEDTIHPAVEVIANATGLDFDYVGTTSERPFAEQYLPRPGPVVIGWGDSDEFPDLAGDIAGLGGATPQQGRSGTYYVNGSVVLDTDYFSDSSTSGSARNALVVHELGHVVGLDHVDDGRQLMHARGTQFNRRLAAGDRQGLAKLGQIPCR